MLKLVSLCFTLNKQILFAAAAFAAFVFLLALQAIFLNMDSYVPELLQFGIRFFI